MHFHPLRRRRRRKGKKKRYSGELSFLYIGELKIPYNRAYQHGNSQRTMALLYSTIPDDLQVSPISISHSLNSHTLFYKSFPFPFPCFVWLLRKYTIIEEQDFRNFSYEPKSWQLNRVLAVEYYKKLGGFFSWDNMVLMIFFLTLIIEALEMSQRAF